MHGYLLLIALVLSPAVSLGADPPDRVCAELWQRVGPLQEEVHGIPLSTEVPDGRVVSGFNVKSLHRSDGSRFVPNSIQESKSQALGWNAAALIESETKARRQDQRHYATERVAECTKISHRICQ